MPVKSALKNHKVILASLAAATAVFFLIDVHGHFYVLFSPDSYLVTHGITEGIGILVCVLTFAITWHSFYMARNHQFLFLGTAFLAVGIIDAFHTLSYAGMPDFITPNTVNKATLFWISARLLGSFAYLAYAFIRPDTKNRFLQPVPLISLMLVLAGLVGIVVLFFPETLPAMFVSGRGLTPVKIYLEYVVVLLMALTAFIFLRKYLNTGYVHHLYFFAALVFGVYSEFFFTFYSSAYDFYNLMGHVYKVVMFFLIYQTLFATSVKEPYLRLRDAQEELKDYMLTLEEKVNDRTRDLAEKNAELEKLNRLKTDFLAMCSHDMKSPLQGTMLMLDLLLEEAEGRLNDEQKKSLDAIRKNEEDLYELITNLLELARQEESAMRLNAAEVDLAGLIRQWAGKQQVIAAKRGRAFRVTMPGDTGPCILEADRFKVNQVLNNLMSNALKFTPSGGEIVLSFSREDGHYKVCLFNSGPAIPADQLTRIFDKYVRTGRSRDEKEGMGLGLNICKGIVELHGGRIWAESEEGNGNTFTFTLPRRP